MYRVLKVMYGDDNENNMGEMNQALPPARKFQYTRIEIFAQGEEPGSRLIDSVQESHNSLKIGDLVL